VCELLLSLLSYIDADVFTASGKQKLNHTGLGHFPFG